MKKETLLVPPTEENAFLHAYPLIKRIASRHLRRDFQDSVEDVAQRVMLKLWQWNTRRRLRKKNNLNKDHSVGDSAGTGDGNDNFEDCCPLHALSVDDWQRLANTAIRNEIKTFFAAKDKKEVLLEEEIADERHVAIAERIMNTKVEGNAQYEIKSQLCGIWKILVNLSLKEKYALLLKERTLYNYLIIHDCCKIREITDCLALTKEEFINVYKGMPLSDSGIAALLEAKLRQSVSPAHVTKARQRARKRIRSALAGEYGFSNENGRASKKRKT